MEPADLAARTEAGFVALHTALEQLDLEASLSEGSSDDETEDMDSD